MALRSADRRLREDTWSLAWPGPPAPRSRQRCWRGAELAAAQARRQPARDRPARGRPARGRRRPVRCPRREAPRRRPQARPMPARSSPGRRRPPRSAPSRARPTGRAAGGKACAYFANANQDSLQVSLLRGASQAQLSAIESSVQLPGAVTSAVSGIGTPRRSCGQGRPQW